eukprot:354244-Chlamydomonas_euryale.AAC.4
MRRGAGACCVPHSQRYEQDACGPAVAVAAIRLDGRGTHERRPACAGACGGRGGGMVETRLAQELCTCMQPLWFLGRLRVAMQGWLDTQWGGRVSVYLGVWG